MSRIIQLAIVSRALPLAAALVLSVYINSAAAEPETVELGNGASVTVEEYLVETSQEGHKTLVVRTVPNFDPEPFGKVPADDYARRAQPICTKIVNYSSDALDEHKIETVRIRWDFTPSNRDAEMPENMTLTRFHEMAFDVTNDAPCLPMPYGVRHDILAPELSGDIVPTLRWAEPGLTPGELSLTYSVETGLADISSDSLERIAIELCILHGDFLLETRARYYSQLESRTVAITLAQNDGKPGYQLLRRVTFPVKDDKCVTGLSEMLTEAILTKAMGFAADPTGSN